MEELICGMACGNDLRDGIIYAEYDTCGMTSGHKLTENTAVPNGAGVNHVDKRKNGGSSRSIPLVQQWYVVAFTFPRLSLLTHETTDSTHSVLLKCL